MSKINKIQNVNFEEVRFQLISDDYTHLVWGNLLRISFELA